MYFDLDDDQRELVATVTGLCERQFPLDTARAWGEPGGFDRTAWRALAETGTFVMTRPEAAGGLDLAPVDAGLVFQALGAALVPGPLVATALAAELVDEAGTGEKVVALAVRPPAAAALPVPLLVEHLGDADTLLVLDDSGVHAVDPARVTATRLERPLDPTTPLWLVDDLPAGEAVADAATAARWARYGSLLASALLAGGAVRVTEIAAEYARQREQFGRPVGSFQAVKHMLADSFARGEVARASVDAAAVLLGENGDGDDTRRAVAGARVMAAAAAVSNAKTAIQVHGGMGFTWETSPHLYLKRAQLLATAFTTPDEAAEAVAGALIPDPAGPGPMNPAAR